VKSVELLAPAGDPDCAYAALHYGADAVYVGMRRFSARAEAGNFSVEELGEVVDFAHSLSPGRSVYVALNTLIRDAEIHDVLDVLMAVAEAGADALIVQDAGVAALARRYCPGVRLHASTQMAIHNLEGAKAAAVAGFSRVTLARELTLPEIGAIAAGSGVEVEVFLHGALCYSYSGLCLYSALLRGRSGNRGRCAYPCRDIFTQSDGKGEGLMFSMKDLAAPQWLPELRKAGVASLKIEGRKKSPLYVASTVDFYRRLLDGESLASLEKRGLPEDIRTVFSRPWTALHLKSRSQRGVIDPEFVGHRGARIGRAAGVVRRDGVDWLRLVTERRLERHDGIQVELTGETKPFGFAVDALRVADSKGRWRSAYETGRHTEALLALPPGHPPIPVGAVVYCASSQAVKQRYPFQRPRPGVYRARRVLDVDVRIEPGAVLARGRIRGLGEVAVETRMEGALEPCRDPDQVADAFRGVFAKLGNTAYTPGTVSVRNDSRRFVPVSAMNRLRRECVELLDRQDAERRAALLAKWQAAAAVPTEAAVEEPLRWMVRTDRLSHLEAWSDEDWRGVTEAVIGIELDPVEAVAARADDLRSRYAGLEVRVAMPVITRAWEREEIGRRVRFLFERGQRMWEVSSAGAWEWLRELCGTRERTGGLRVAADWPLYGMNGVAVQSLLEEGLEWMTLSPENDEENVRALLTCRGSRLVLPAYMDPPLFLSENCPQTALNGSCRDGRSCREASAYRSGSGEEVVVLHRNCRTIVIPREPFCVAGRIESLRRSGLRRVRADFVWRRYTPEEALSVWRRLRAGVRAPGLDPWAQVGKRPAAGVCSHP